MALPKPADEAASILYDQRGQRVAVEPPIEPTADPATPMTVADAETNAPPPEQQGSILDTAAVPAVIAPDKPVQVAGVWDKISGAIARRVGEAERKILPKIPDVPVQEIGNNLLIRGLEPEEVAKVASIVGDDFAKGINFPRITDELGMPSVGDYLARMKAANADLFEKTRRGTISFETMLAEAQKKGADELLIQWAKDGVQFGAKAEDVIGGFLAAIALTNEMEKAWRAAFSIAEPTARTAAMTRASQMTALTNQIFAHLSAAGSEAGRTQRAIGLLGKATGVDLAARADEVQKLFNSDAAQDLEYMGQQILSLRTTRQRETYLRQGFNATMDVMAEVYINSILLAPPTHGANIMGNAAFMALRVAETAVAGAIGGVRTSITGSTDRVYMREAWGQLQGMRDGFLDAMRVAGKTLLTEEPSDLVSKLDIRNRRAIGTTGDPRVILEEFRNGNYLAGAINTLGSVVRTGGRLLLTEDEFFKGIGYRMHIHGEAEARGLRLYDQAIELGKTPQEALALRNAERARIIADPPQSVIANAQAAAREMTFQKDLDGFLGAAQTALSHPVVKLFVPFFKTPTNIAKAVLERSPAQFINPGFYKTLAAGGREADIAMAKVAMGSAVMGTMAGLAIGLDNDSAMIITGAGPNDPQAKDAFARKGMLPYSIAIKQDDGTYKSITYSRFDPISGMLGMAADFAYYSQYEPDGAVLEDLAAAATIGLSSYMMDQPLLQGVNQIADALVLARSDKAAATDRIAQILGERLTSGATAFIPGTSSLGGTIARYQNPEKASTMLPATGLMGEDPTELPDFMKGFYIALQKAKANNPFFNPSLPRALNAWGEPIPASDGSVWDFVSPVKIRDSKYSPVDDEIQRLGGGVAPFPKKIDGVELNAEQYNRWITLTNTFDMDGKLPGDAGYRADRTLLSILAELIALPEYQRADADKQRDKMTSYVSGMRAAAKTRLLQEDPYLKAKIDAGK